MIRNENLGTVELYEPSPDDRMIGAFYVPAKRMAEGAETMAKAVCKLMHLDAVAVICYDRDGAETARDLIFR